MDIAVTGGAGYLGSILVPRLLKSGHKVTVFDSFRYSTNQLLSQCYNDKFTVVNGDVRNKYLLESVIAGKEIIIPLAALVGQKLCEFNADEAYSINVDSIDLLLKTKQAGQKVIFTSTHSCYGGLSTDSLCDEQSEVMPLTEYSRTKKQAETIALKDPNTVVLRVGTMFGVSPRMRIELTINNLVFRAVSDKYAIVDNNYAFRNYIHVRDVADAILFTINNFELMKGQLYNIGNQNLNLTAVDICQTIQSIIPDFIFSSRDDLIPYDKRNYKVSMDKINRLGWQANIKLEDGIYELIKAYKMIKPINFSNF